MDKNLIWGVGAIAGAGLLVGGLMMSGNNSGDRKIDQEQESTVSDEDKQKIEDLGWDEWKDKDKYSFCLGEAKAQTNYSDPVLGSKGELSHSSKELLLWNGESRKLYIITRQIIYKYNGQVNLQMGNMAVSFPVNEYGSLVEVYPQNQMPIRVDYYNNFIASNPDTEEKNRVSSNVGEESEMVSDRMGCAGVYELGFQAKDLPSVNQGVSLQKSCKEVDINGSYDGTFSFACNMIEYDQAKNIFETAKIEEELQNTKDESVFENQEDDELTKALSNSEQRDTTIDAQQRDTTIDAQKKLQELRLEMQADQRGE